MTVIKRDRSESTSDLVRAIDALVPLLKDQGEDEAISDLQLAAGELKVSKPGEAKHKAAISKIIDAYEGDHELMAYTMQRPNSNEWTEVEELSQASSRVLSLARRMR